MAKEWTMNNELPIIWRNLDAILLTNQPAMNIERQNSLIDKGIGNDDETTVPTRDKLIYNVAVNNIK